MKKCKTLFILLLVTPFVAICRYPVEDSLWNVLKHEKEDTNRANTLNKMAEMYCQHTFYPLADSLSGAALILSQKCNYVKGIAYAYMNLGYTNLNEGNSKKALEYAQLCLKEYTSIGNKPGIRDAYSALGNIYRVLASYPEALKNYSLSLQIDTVLQSKPGTAADYGNIGIVFSEQGNYPMALEYQLKSLKLREELHDKHGVAGCYGNIGNIYSYQNNDKEALRNFQLCLKISEEINDKLSITNCYSSIADIYSSEGNYPVALEYNKKSLSLDQEMGNKDGLSADYDNLSTVYLYLGNYAQSMLYARKCLDLSRETGDQRAMAAATGNIASVLYRQKKYTEAKPYMDTAVTIAKQTGVKSLLIDLYLGYAQMDSAMGDYKTAFIHYKDYIAYRDSLKNEQNTKKLVQEQMNYEFEKKEAIAKAAQDKKDVLDASAKRKQQVITGSVSIGLLLVLVFSFLLFSRYRVAKKQKTIIEEQKLVVEEKNKEVLDSITYAKRLQDAILPPLSLIGHYLPDSLILYKPKDIVAGDFYWVQPLPDSILVAACDCTGHGVPGAMVSVVCSNALNRAVKEFKITEPGKILDKTRELVMETFEKSEGEIKDGMDISLCRINTKTGEVFWSGAYNPLWYIHNGEIKELTGDKQPIGKHVTQQPFSTHSLQLSKGDSLYLFTDGYADQFGGPKGKKFKYKALQELITANFSKPLNEQKKLLEDTFENWKSSMEQTDDVCLIGIRI